MACSDRNSKIAQTILEDPNTKHISSNPNIYRLNLNLKQKDKNIGIRYFTFGDSRNSNLPEKVLMIVGATGSGKSTFLNGIINYLLNVQWSDPYRFKVVTPEDEECEHANNQAFSQTGYITAYTFYHHKDMPIGYNVTIIDTPGYGDCRGMKRDQEITKQIKMFFNDHNIVDHLDAVCFIAAAPGRLTPTQKYIIDAILSIYAKNIVENIILLITFADGQNPPVLESIKEANVPYKTYYKFNNSALFANNEDADDELSVDGMFWKIGMTNMKKFFKEVEKLEAKSLKLTNEVMREREQLQTILKGIPPQINTTVRQMEHLTKEKDILSKCENKVRESENFEYEIEEEVTVKFTSPRYANNCDNCKVTCDYDCTASTPYMCAAMTWLSGCRICPDKCSSLNHVIETFTWGKTTRTQRKVYQDTKKQYEVAIQGKKGQEEVIRKMEEVYKTMKSDLLTAINKVKMTRNRLNEIALKPNPLSTADYIDILIMEQTNEAKPGWQERVKQFEEVRKEANTLTDNKDDLNRLFPEDKQ